MARKLLCSTLLSSLAQMGGFLPWILALAAVGACPMTGLHEVSARWLLSRLWHHLELQLALRLQKVEA
jgi:hypothetical protein